ncbi:MAG: CrcB family protein [Pseudoxanthomonas sp.]|nr:CrcB family protein [Pseudoxanthomonas sp.]
MAAGSALGASLRWGAGLGLHGQAALIGMPWGTSGVNVVGSLLIGLYAAMTGVGGRSRSTPQQRAFVMAGVCGGFTTFSLFTAELLGCLQRGQWGLLVVVATA